MSSSIALNDLIADITKARSSKEWIDLFAEAGVPAGPINAIAPNLPASSRGDAFQFVGVTTW